MNSETELFMYNKQTIIEQCRAIAVNDLLKRNFRRIPKVFFKSKWFMRLHAKIFKYELSYKNLVPRKNEAIRELIALLRNGKKVDSLVFSVSGVMGSTKKTKR